MLPLNLIYLLIVAGNLLVILYDIIRVRSLRKRAKEMAASTGSRTVLVRESDAYAGAFIAAVFIALSTTVFLLGGLSAWDPGREVDWSDPGTLLRAGLRVGILILPAVLTSRSFSLEIFSVSNEGIEQVKGQETTKLAWREVTAIAHDSKSRRRGIMLTGPRGVVMVPEDLKDVESLYEAAVRHLPEAFHQDPTYLWMASVAAHRDT